VLSVFKYLKYLVVHVTIFKFFIPQISIETSTVHFTYSNFTWGLPGGVDVKWSGGVLVLELH
jgi:hypothetical protein